MAIQVPFARVSGETIATLECEPSHTILSLRQRLSSPEVLNIPVPLLKLIWQGEVPNDSATLESCGITGLEVVTLVQESAARLALLPGFDGVYTGEESEGGGKAVYELVLDSLDFKECGVDDARVEGRIHWKYVRGQSSWKEDEGKTAQEFVRGTVEANGKLHLDGYKVTDDALIAPCKYELELNDCGSSIQGFFLQSDRPVLEGDDKFDLRKVSSSLAQEWRSHHLRSAE